MSSISPPIISICTINTGHVRMPGIFTTRTCSTCSISTVEEISLICVSGTIHTHVCCRIPELTVYSFRTVLHTVTLHSTSSVELLIQRTCITAIGSEVILESFRTVTTHLLFGIKEIFSGTVMTSIIKSKLSIRA